MTAAAAVAVVVGGGGGEHVAVVALGITFPKMKKKVIVVVP
jgi:hypothetical protein